MINHIFSDGKDIPIAKCECGALYQVAGYFTRDVGDAAIKCPACLKEIDFSKIHFVSAVDSLPCNVFELDANVCDDFGEPKGQCCNCGHDKEDHLSWQIGKDT